MNKELVLSKKSIMYKIISLGYPVYIGDDDEEFLVTTLICSECFAIWSMSRSECMFCGMENPHIYQCRRCGNKYSITRTSKVCCDEKLVKVCINDNCISNNEAKDFFDELGGVFEMDKSGATLNEMRCKKCGSIFNEYKSILIKLVSNFNECNDVGKCYLKKISHGHFEAKYNNKLYKFNNIEEFMDSIIKG